MSHTPGPWDYRPMRHDDWGWVRARNGGVLVARAGGPATDEEQRAHRVAGTDPFEANARLIAAAPDLLAALKAATQFITPEIARGPAINGWLNTVNMVDAAIAKAEGR